MLSILIPTYKYVPEPLVRALVIQLKKVSFSWEIIVSDDCSGTPSENDFQVLSSIHPAVRFNILSENRGRFENRRSLAQLAKYDRLLYLDDDAVLDESFIEIYSSWISKKETVFGGMKYAERIPEDPKLHLRWKVGKKREEIPARLRNEKPYAGIQTCNFMISKEAMLALPQHKEIYGYGHEDTMMGYDLRYAFVPVVHIDNAIGHSKLDTADVFLEKTSQAVKNLARLIKAGKVDENIRLYQFYSRLQKTRTTGLLRWYGRQRAGNIIHSLLKPNPSLYLFDWYKLALLCVEVEKQ
jgi:glycosyltransferase involved in cell wall biosynthesis